MVSTASLHPYNKGLAFGVEASAETGESTMGFYQHSGSTGPGTTVKGVNKKSFDLHMEVSQDISTSDQPDFPGFLGDVVLGKAVQVDSPIRLTLG